MLEIRTAGLESYLEGGDGKYRILILGTPGSGKTPFAAQFPDPFFLMADRGGENSLVLTRTPYVKIRSEADALEVITYLERESKRPSFIYKTVVLDTISVLQSHVIQEILRREGKKSLDDFRNWGELSSIMKGILNRLQNLPMHLVVLVHLKDKFDANGEIEPDLTGGLKVDLPKEFPYIGHLHTDWDVVKVDGVDTKVVVRKIGWRAIPQVPFLRSASNLLPPTTPVTFTPSDFDAIQDAIVKGVQADWAQGSSVIGQIVSQIEEKAAPPDIQGGPVEPKPDGVLPKARAAAAKPVTKAAAARAKKDAVVEPHDAAVNAIQEELGASVTSDDVIPAPRDWIAELNGAATVVAVKEIWNAAGQAGELTSSLKAELTVRAAALKKEDK